MKIAGKIRIDEHEKILFVTILGIFLLYMISPILYGMPFMDVSDNIFHMVNHRYVWTGENPFLGITNYPMLFYYIPLPIILTELLIGFLALPIMLYFLTGLFINEKIYRIYPPIIWLMCQFSFRIITLYGQICSMLLISLFMYFWVKKRYTLALLLLIPIPFGHRGSTYYILVLSIFAFIDYIRRAKFKFPSISIFGLNTVHNYKLNYLLYYSLADIFLIVLTFLGIKNIDKNKETYALLMIITLPSLLFSTRGYIPLIFFGAIALSKSLPYDPKVIFYPMIILTILSNCMAIQNYYRGYYNFNTIFDELLEFNRDGDAYCFYPTLTYAGWYPAHVTMRAWIYEDIPVKACERDKYLEVIEKIGELRKEERIEILKKRLNKSNI